MPHQSRLFLAYQRDPKSLSKYYPNVVESVADLAKVAGNVCDNYVTDRDRLCDALLRINGEINAGDPTERNIERLRDPSTVAVVTGQQAGLFTGPLYTIYKALTAVKIAETLTASGTPAVPVFWAATEDHDFEEVSEVFALSESGAAIRTTYEPKNRKDNISIGEIEIDDGIATSIGDFLQTLPPAEFTNSLRDTLADQWRSGNNLGQAFLSTLASLLSKFGIIYLDPMDVELKSLASPIYAAAVEQANAITAEIVKRSDELTEEKFHAQVTVEKDYFPLFWIDDDGQRLALRSDGAGNYRVKGTRQRLSRSDLVALAHEKPATLSPGVMLRPVVQDYLLPTVCYVGGAAEVAYFAQNSVAYQLLGRPVTPIVHRQSFTVVEARHRRTFEKYGLEFADIFDGYEKLMVRVVEDLAPEMPQTFAEVEEKINTELNRLDQSLSHLDPTLAANLATRRRKIVYHIAALKKKAMLARGRKDDDLERRLNALFAELLPRGALQERTVNVFTYLNKFGPGFIDTVYASIDLESRGHRLISI